MEEEVDIKTELESTTVVRREIDPKHQFNDTGMQYEDKGHLWLWLLVFILLAVGVIYIILSPQGQSFINSLRNQQNDSANFPVSYASSSTTSTQLVPLRDFTGAELQDIKDVLMQDLDKIAGHAKPEVDYPSYDSEIEFGVKAKEKTTVKK